MGNFKPGDRVRINPKEYDKSAIRDHFDLDVTYIIKDIDPYITVEKCKLDGRCEYYGHGKTGCGWFENRFVLYTEPEISADEIKTASPIPTDDQFVKFFERFHV